MTTEAAPRETNPSNSVSAEVHAAQRDLLLKWARAGWWVLTALVLICFARGAPILVDTIRRACTASPCPSPRLTTAQVATLQRLGLSLHGYALTVVALEALFVLGFIAIAAVMVSHQATGWFALYGAWVLVLFGGTVFPDTISALRDSGPVWRWSITLSQFAGSATLVPFFYLFPDGRFVPRWTRQATAGWVVVCALGFFTPLDFPLNQDPNNPSHLFPILALGFVASVVCSQVYRYRHVSPHVQRQQVKWVTLGLLAAFSGLFVSVFLIEPRVNGAASGAIAFRLLGLTDGYLVLVLVPLSIGIAIVRYQLWDIDILLHRTLVYGTLTGAVVTLYILIVTIFSVLFQTEAGELIPSLIATALIAVLFQPLKARLQHAASRLLYGERDDPYTVLARLGERLSATLAPASVLPAVAQTVCETLKLPYATIALREGQAFVTVAASGRPEATSLCLTLVYQHENVGQLCLAPRARGESFSTADLRLLQDLARQAGVAAHAVRLANELQHARERLVIGREEERRRIRRDLHDGLGPVLGSCLLRIGVAEDLIGENPVAARALLADLKTQTRTAIDDIRRLVYALRPPALDDFGLIGALQESASAYERAGMCVTINVPDPLPPLSAAVEVAAFRIAQEALTNVMRHADAQTCVIHIALDPPGVLCLDIVDDGRGLFARQRHGIGLASMRERAEELGGTLEVTPRAGSGTRVHACLPLAAAAPASLATQMSGTP